MKKSSSIKRLLRKNKIKCPVTYHFLTENSLKEKRKELPHRKFIDIADLQTLTYPINDFYKPISRVL